MSQWDGFESRIERNAHKMLDLLDEADVKATFFILGHVADHFPHLVREIAKRGHVPGTHGYSHKQVYKQAPQEFGEELKRAVGTVRDLTGQRLYGYRAPIFSIVRESLWALDILLDQGLMYDSSIFPVLNYRYGMVSNHRFAHSLTTPSGRTIVEIPVAATRFLNVNVPVGGGAYLRILPYAITRAGLRRINKESQPFAFYVHPWEVDPDHPRAPNVPFRISATHYFNLRSTDRKLRKLLSDFKFAPIETAFASQLALP